MAEMGRWAGHAFIVSPNLIRSWSDLQIKGSSGTENTESDGQQYVTRKKGNAAELSFTLRLHALTGCSVREEAMAFVEEAMAGESDYFYIGGEKLLPCQMMLTDATVSETEITNSGIWVRADVQITMRQASPKDREETPEAAQENGRAHSQKTLNGRRGGYNNGVKFVQMIM